MLETRVLVSLPIYVEKHKPIVYQSHYRADNDELCDPSQEEVSDEAVHGY